MPSLIEELLAHPDGAAVEIGRQRRREVVLLAASRFDSMVEREALIADLAWGAFAQERVENPVSEPVGWDEAQRRRAGRRAGS